MRKSINYVSQDTADSLEEVFRIATKNRFFKSFQFSST